MSGMAQKADVTISCNISFDAVVEVDPDRITQVLANLLSNAIKYSPRGGLVLISVDTLENGRVRYSITDEGEGISTENIEKLFGKISANRQFGLKAKEGTGLGLSISKAIVEQHNGTIGVHSRPGIGSTFWFELPYLEEDLKGESDTLEPSDNAILIVEDDLNLAQLLKISLKKKGFCPRHVTTIRGANIFLEKHRPSVIIADIMLPDGNGIDFLETVKENPDLEQTPVIVISGRDREEFEFAHPFIYAWFHKPFDLNELTGTINGLLSGKKKVLIVEDDDETRTVIATQLKKLKAFCLEASDGESAVEIALDKKPDVIILDISLPQMDGFEVVKALSGKPPPALLVYSGRDLDSQDRGQVEVGCDKTPHKRAHRS